MSICLNTHFVFIFLTYLKAVLVPFLKAYFQAVVIWKKAFKSFVSLVFNNWDKLKSNVTVIIFFIKERRLFFIFSWQPTTFNKGSFLYLFGCIL